MTHNKKDIFSPTLCPNEQTLLLYVKGELSTVENRAIELHLCDCEMCSAYADGLSEMQNPDGIILIKDALDAKIDNVLKKRNSLFPLIFKIAASVLLISFLSIIIYKQHLEEKSQVENLVTLKDTTENTIALFDEAVPIKTEAVAEEEKDIRKTSEHTAQKQKSIPATPPSERISIMEDLDETKYESITFFEQEIALTDSEKINGHRYDEVMKMEEVQQNMTTAPVMLPTSTISLNASDAVAESIVATRAESMGRSKRRQAKVDGEPATAASGKSMTENDIQNNNLRAALIEIEKRNYPQALQILKKLNPSDSVHYYTAFSLYNLNAFSDALKHFEKLQGKTNFSLYPQTEWYYANSLISTDSLEEASIVLQGIIDKNGKYAEQASKLIKEIK